MVELLLECASGGTWVHLIYPSGVVSPPPVSLQEEVIFYYLKQVLEGLHHLHSHGWWHRDIKPSNIGITTDGIVKILDYGGAMRRGLNPGQGMTVNYLPPEVCADKQNCSEKMDIWALACSVIFLTTGVEVYTYLPERIRAVTNGPLPTDQKNLVKHIAAYGIHVVEFMPKDDRYTWLKNLVKLMLNPVPHDRWSALACLDYINRKEKLTPTTVTVSVPSVLPDIQQLLQDQTEKPDAQCKDTTSGYQTQPPRREGDLREIETRERNREEQNREEEELGSQKEFYPGHIPIDM
ncbi:cyclin-dependent kinase 8 isoform X1 [Lingula anatina]|uniref:Cyclin-dependent kinase 8 isoform X1 n=1 Tax=Lingula anatina TaxID=7574 RepID=A0A1S3HUN7_LINAN|nr:cyclin-dependent kinase 8 isoform X1 [Lingula anatina]|eukprot:XP_013389757.1 cyclin-dependent kinase 8 isoform X1 [Lingula anatina]